MSHLLSLTLVAGIAIAAQTPGVANAAQTPERIRGTITAVGNDTLSVHTTSGSNVSVTLTGGTRYLELAPSNLDHVDPGSYIGTATKSIGNQQVALEVVIFPPSLRGTGEGHYAWDRIPDTTLSGNATTASSMTNGTIAMAAPVGGTQLVNSAMTNGTVSSAGEADGARQITVTYKGGKQTVLVPPTAPIVRYQLGTAAEVKSGAKVFVNAVRDGNSVTARSVAVGIDGVTPPM